MACFCSQKQASLAKERRDGSWGCASRKSCRRTNGAVKMINSQMSLAAGLDSDWMWRLRKARVKFPDWSRTEYPSSLGAKCYKFVGCRRSSDGLVRSTAPTPPPPRLKRPSACQPSGMDRRDAGTQFPSLAELGRSRASSVGDKGGDRYS